MKPIVYTYHVEYANDAVGASAIMENVLKSGAEGVQAKRFKNDGRIYYKVEYKLPRKDEEDAIEND